PHLSRRFQIAGIRMTLSKLRRLAYSLWRTGQASFLEAAKLKTIRLKVRFDIILTAAAAIVGAAAAWSGYQMGLVQFGKPGAGLFPLLIGVLLALLSALEFLRAWNASVELPLGNAGHHFALSS